jgi:hypothetical protein
MPEDNYLVLLLMRVARPLCFGALAFVEGTNLLSFASEEEGGAKTST